MANWERRLVACLMAWRPPVYLKERPGAPPGDRTGNLKEPEQQVVPLGQAQAIPLSSIASFCSLLAPFHIVIILADTVSVESSTGCPYPGELAIYERTSLVIASPDLLELMRMAESLCLCLRSAGQSPSLFSWPKTLLARRLQSAFLLFFPPSRACLPLVARTRAKKGKLLFSGPQT
ncbi:hypothetical protein VNO77_31453 [Canavalia gladiata]|uniref:Uncharacterized protein n=1 Tax=Canavalia gladiata TaxID=3824 RepID=A0AAN9KRN9_CANGL